MVRNAVVAVATALVVAFSIWFQATQTVPHDVDKGGTSGEHEVSGGGDTGDHGGKPGETKP